LIGGLCQYRLHRHLSGLAARLSSSFTSTIENNCTCNSDIHRSKFISANLWCKSISGRSLQHIDFPTPTLILDPHLTNIPFFGKREYYLPMFLRPTVFKLLSCPAKPSLLKPSTPAVVGTLATIKGNHRSKD